MADAFDNDDIVFGNDNLDPATGQPVVKGLDVIATDKLSGDQKGYLTQFAPDISDATFNSKGDIVDATGKVVVTKTELDIKLSKPIDKPIDKPVDVQETPELKASTLIKENEGQLITIDGVEYKIKNGKAVNTKDEVILDSTALTAKIIESFDDAEDVEYIKEISKLTGYTPVDDKGTPIQYEDSVEGYAKYINDVVTQESSRIVSEKQNEFFTEYPVLKDAYNFLKVNGSLENYGRVTDHSQVRLDKDNDDQLSSLIIEAEMLRGRTKEQAARMAKYAKDDNRMLEEAKDSLLFIQTKETSERTEREKQVALMNAKAEADAIAYWGGVKSTIDKGELEGYVIPTNIQIRTEDGRVLNKTREDFYRYVSESVDNNGNSAAAIARANKGAELELLIDYVMFTGGDIKQLATLQAKAENAKKAKLEIGRNKEQKSKVIIGNAGNNTKVDNNQIV